tara:strand:- start:426 stop:1079 length:654 start_codon:yes stop_codon:yes gene_type:complete
MAVMTTVPQRQKRATISSNIARSDIQGWMRSLTTSAQRATRNAGAIITYPVIKEFNGRIPILETRTFPQLPNEPCMVTVGSSGLMFTRMQLLKNAVQSSPLIEHPCTDYALDYALSSIVYHAGGVFYVPDILYIVIEKRVDRPLRMRPVKWNSKTFSKHFIDDQYSQYVGVDMKKRIVFGRGRMGLTPDMSEKEIMQKYATMGEFNRIKVALTESGM